MKATIATSILAAIDAALGVATAVVTDQTGPVVFCFLTTMVLGCLAWSLVPVPPQPARFPIRNSKSED
jgi:hypothetical protein